jgi:hypothetical protein
VAGKQLVVLGLGEAQRQSLAGEENRSRHRLSGLVCKQREIRKQSEPVTTGYQLNV